MVEARLFVVVPVREISCAFGSFLRDRRSHSVPVAFELLART